MAKAIKRVGVVLAWAMVIGYAIMFAARAALSDELPKRQPTPPDWVGWALADLVTLPEADRAAIRYLAIPPWGNEQWVPMISFALNTSVSQARTIVRPDVIANGWMLRVDMRRFVPDPVARIKTLAVWDGLAKTDPYLHVPKENSRVDVAVIAPTLPQDQAVLLAQLTLSAGAVYRADWFFKMCLDTLDGGQYYEFRQLPLSTDAELKDLSEFDRYLRGRGVFLRATQEAGGEQRAAITASDVTGKPRRADVGVGLSGKVWSVTRDIADGGQQAERHPLRNLIDFRDQGREVFVTLPNGMIECTLFDGAGKLVREAPPELVRDHNIPPPYTARLRPARSCIICHNTAPADGWREMPNDVQTILRSGRLDVVADVADATRTREEVIDQLAGLYGLEVDSPDGLLGRARRDYNAAVARTVPVGIAFPPDVSLVSSIGKLVKDTLYDYDYQRIDGRRAALELGYTFPDSIKDPLSIVLGPDDPTREVDGVAAYLRAGLRVNRADFEVLYQDLLRQSGVPK
jgi:hypothetical protein